MEVGGEADVPQPYRASFSSCRQSESSWKRQILLEAFLSFLRIDTDTTVGKKVTVANVYVAAVFFLILTFYWYYILIIKLHQRAISFQAF